MANATRWQVLIQTEVGGKFVAQSYWSEPFADIRPARRWRIKAARVFHGAKLVEIQAEVSEERKPTALPNIRERPTKDTP